MAVTLPVTIDSSVASSLVSASTNNCAVGTLMLNCPCAFTLPVKVLLLTITLTTSPAANSPDTLPVMDVFRLAASLVLIRLSPVIGLTIKAVSGLPLTSTP